MRGMQSQQPVTQQLQRVITGRNPSGRLEIPQRVPSQQITIAIRHEPRVSAIERRAEPDGRTVRVQEPARTLHHATNVPTRIHVGRHTGHGHERTSRTGHLVEDDQIAHGTYRPVRQAIHAFQQTHRLGLPVSRTGTLQTRRERGKEPAGRHETRQIIHGRSHRLRRTVLPRPQRHRIGQVKPVEHGEGKEPAMGLLDLPYPQRDRQPAIRALGRRTPSQRGNHRVIRQRPNHRNPPRIGSHMHANA